MISSGSTILILGLAREGISLARYFTDRGAHVIVTDPWAADRVSRFSNLLSPAVELFVGSDYPELVERADRVFVSPGIPESNPVYGAVRESGITAESMTTLFFDLCPAPIVGVTGSSGKTTTTSLIGHLLQAAGRDVVVGGNIGEPMLDLLPRIENGTTVVLELSSFQLSIMQRSPHIAVITNISPNHLDRHETMEKYVESKVHIVCHQNRQDYVVLNSRDAWMDSFVSSTPASPSWFGFDVAGRQGATVLEGLAGVHRNGVFSPVLAIDQIPLLGRHNVENVLAALATGDLLGLDIVDVAAGVRTFRPPAHRLETVGERSGVRFVDDSIATSPARATAALRAIDAPVVLIAGGRDKCLPWDEFASTVIQKARALILIGEAAPQIECAVCERLVSTGALRAEAIRRCITLEEAVREATALAQPGDVVLLSPGCASYDMFRDYEERGTAFVRAVESANAA